MDPVHALLWVALLAADWSPDKIRQAARELVAQPEVQSRLPGSEAPFPDRRAPAPEPKRSGGDDARLPRSAPAGGVLNGAAYALLIALGAGALIMLIRWLWLEARDRRRPPIVVAEAAPAAAAPVPTAADELAAEGRWDAAVHALLLSAIAHAVARLEPPPPRSFTSREVVGRIAAPARHTLAELVRRVETVHFGGAPAGEEDFRRCRELSRGFAETFR